MTTTNPVVDAARVELLLHDRWQCHHGGCRDAWHPGRAGRALSTRRRISSRVL
jgi:hypothetical protein